MKFLVCTDHKLEHLKWQIRTFPARFCSLVKLNIYLRTLLQRQMYLQHKNTRFAMWAHVDTKFLNLSHVLSIDDGLCGGLKTEDELFPVGLTFEDHPQIFSQKGLRLDLFKSLFLSVMLNIYIYIYLCTLLQGQVHLQFYKHSMVFFFLLL